MQVNDSLLLEMLGGWYLVLVSGSQVAGSDPIAILWLIGGAEVLV